MKVVNHVQPKLAQLVADIASIKDELGVVKVVHAETNADVAEMKASQSLMNESLEDLIIWHEDMRI